MNKINTDKLSIAFRDKALCTRSGTCIGVCPTGALSIGKDAYPEIDADLCTECGLCAKTCPGGEVNFKSLTEITFKHQNIAESFDGHIQRTFVGYAADVRMRKGGAGGGVITALLWDLLRRNIVDGCIVTRMNPDRPWYGEAFIARTYKELLESQQSKYIIIPLNAMFKEIRKLPGRYAMAALPCHIHGFRLMQRHVPALTNKIHCVIGLFCASALETHVALEIMQARNIDKSQVKKFDFRGGKWPGAIRAILKNGQIKRLHYSNFKDGAINYLTYLYSPFRCQTCIDGSAEFSDISVSDAWTRDEFGDYVFDSQSKMLVRTHVGMDVLNGATESGSLVVQDVSQNRHYQTHKLHTKKKGLTAPIRVERLLKKGKTAPKYDKPLPPISRSERIGERLESLIMSIGKRRSTRFPMFKFLTSRYGIILVKIRQYVKSKKYRRK